MKLDVAQVRELIAHLGTTPLVLTVDEDLRARAAGAEVQVGDDSVQVLLGKRSRANARRVGTLSIIWPARPGERNSVVLDAALEPGEGSGADDEPLSARITSALLHVVPLPGAE